MVEIAANANQSSATGLSPFFPNKGFHPRMSFGPDNSAHDDSTKTRLQKEKARSIAEDMVKYLDYTKAALQKSQEVMSIKANKRRKAAEYKEGDMVFVSTRNMKTQRPSEKLDHKMTGPSKILKKAGTSYTLDLLPSMKIYPTFHVELLRKAGEDPSPGQIQEPSEPIIIDGEEEWEVEDILVSSRFGRNGKTTTPCQMDRMGP